MCIGLSLREIVLETIECKEEEKPESDGQADEREPEVASVQPKNNDFLAYGGDGA